MTKIHWMNFVGLPGYMNIVIRTWMRNSLVMSGDSSIPPQILPSLSPWHAASCSKGEPRYCPSSPTSLAMACPRWGQALAWSTSHYSRRWGGSRISPRPRRPRENIAPSHQIQTQKKCCEGRSSITVFYHTNKLNNLSSDISWNLEVFSSLRIP